MRRARAGGDQQPRRAAVEAVHEPRRERIADARHLRVVREEEGGGRAALARIERVARHAARLVERDQGVVLVEDGQGEPRLGRDGRWEVG